VSYSNNFLTSSKKGKKVYLTHPCIGEAFEGEMEKPALGKMVENVLVFQFEGRFFYRKGNREIDIILRCKDKPIPVEVKYSRNIEDKDLKVVRSLVERKNLELGVVATKDLLERRDNILLIPAFIIMLMEDPLNDLLHIFHEMNQN
jgi:predicted AAA+ superfamily ATPase